MEFCLDVFSQIVGGAKDAGYSFCRFDQSPIAGLKRLYLRHDVDISPRNALRMGEIAASIKVQSNLFFQINAETYSVFNVTTLDIVRRLREMGHCVGLHIDEKLLGSNEEKIRRTLDWFSNCCTSVDNVISFHRPTAAVLGRHYDSFVNVYAPPYFGEDRYLADSRRSLAFLPQLRTWMEDGRNPIQLLLHPEWWYHASVDEFWQDLSERRKYEFEDYMMANFGQVFHHKINPIKREYPI